MVDKQGNVAVLLATDEHGGVVGVYGKDGGSAGMGIGEHGGFVRVHRKDGGGASMTTNEHGGFVGVFDGKDGGSVGMGIGEHSGFVGVYRKDGGRAVHWLKPMNTADSLGLLTISAKTVR